MQRGNTLLVVAVLLVATVWIARPRPPDAPHTDDNASPSTSSSRLLDGEVVSQSPSGALRGNTRQVTSIVDPATPPTLRIDVVDEEGAPAVGIPISISIRPPLDAGPVWPTIGDTGFTDADGLLRSDVLPARPCLVFAYVDGLPIRLDGRPSRSEASVEVEGGEALVSLSLRAPTRGVVSGIVEFANGIPAFGVRVTMKVEHGDHAAIENAMDTDVRGRFWFGSVPAEVVVLRTQRWSRITKRHGYGAVRIHAPASNVRIVLLSDDPRQLHLRVVDDQMRPVPKFRWRAVGTVADSTEGLGAGGSATVHDAVGDIWVEVWQAADHEKSPLPLGPALVGPLTADRTHTIVLPSERTITGRVESDLGEPLEGAVVVAEPVVCEPYEPNIAACLDQTTTDKSGVFRLGRIGDQPCRLFAIMPNSHARVLPQIAVGGDGDIVFRVPRSPPVVVLVRDPAGRPIRGIHVEAVDSRWPQPNWLDQFMQFMPDDEFKLVSMNEAASTTNEQGAATLRRLDPEVRYDLEINVDTQSTHYLQRMVGWSPRDTTITLLPAGKFSGTVRREEGKTTEQSVTAKLPDGRTESAYVKDGAFDFERLPVGTITLYLGSKPEGPSVRATVPSLDAVLTFPSRR